MEVSQKSRTSDDYTNIHRVKKENVFSTERSLKIKGNYVYRILKGGFISLTNNGVI